MGAPGTPGQGAHPVPRTGPNGAPGPELPAARMARGGLPSEEVKGAGGATPGPGGRPLLEADGQTRTARPTSLRPSAVRGGGRHLVPGSVSSGYRQGTCT
jgi:hypothetical protein